jgi:hypothetical protein
MAAELSYHRLKTGWLVGIVAAFLIFVAVGVYSKRMTRDYPDYNSDRDQARLQTLAKVRASEDALLHPVDKDGNPTVLWADQDKGFIKIPIEEAMSHEIDDLKAEAVGTGCLIPGAPATLVPPPAPAAPPAAAPATPAPVVAKPETPATGAKKAAANTAKKKPTAATGTTTNKEAH